jgi:hypothetical protein
MLFIATLLLLTINPALQQAKPSIPSKKEAVAQNDRDKETPKPQKSDSEESPNATRGGCSETKQKSESEKQDTNQPKEDMLYRAYLWSTIVGVIGGLLGIAVIYFQTKHVRKSAEAAETAALAAKANADAVVNAERAWVFSAMEKLGPESFSLKFTNHGKTPAEVIDIKQRETWTELMDPDKRELPVPPDYGLETKFVQPRIIVPGKFFVYDNTMLASVLPGEIYSQLKTSRKRYFIYGRVRYRDLIDRTRVRETGFCYFWSPLLDEFIIGGPSEYTYYT